MQFLVDRMILKDNDAGLISGNSAKTYHLLEKKSATWTPKPTTGCLTCKRSFRKPEVAQWYQTELLFTQADFNTMKNNVDQAVEILSNRKDKGLFLDANLEARLSRPKTSRKQEPDTKPEPDNVPDTPLAGISGSVGRWGKRRAQSSSRCRKLCNASWKAAAQRFAST